MPPLYELLIYINPSSGIHGVTGVIFVHEHEHVYVYVHVYVNGDVYEDGDIHVFSSKIIRIFSIQKRYLSVSLYPFFHCDTRKWLFLLGPGYGYHH